MASSDMVIRMVNRAGFLSECEDLTGSRQCEIEVAGDRKHAGQCLTERFIFFGNGQCDISTFYQLVT
jgi:hypothetical protein